MKRYALRKINAVYLILIAFSLSFTVGSKTVSGQDVYSKYISDRNKVAVARYFAKMATFVTFKNRGQRPGDFYELPGFDLNPKRQECFPNLVTAPPLEQNFDQPSMSFEVNLAGLLGAEVADYIKGEISGKIRLFQQVEGTLNNVTAEISDKYILGNHADESACPIVRQFLGGTTGDGKHILIKDVYFASGVIKSIYILEINGTINAEVTNALSRLLSRIGLVDLKLSGKIDAGLRKETKNTFTLQADVPAAFVPFVIDGSDLERVYKEYISNGLDQTLELALQDEKKLDNLFEERSDLRKESDDVFLTLAKGEKFVPYDEKNERHVRYVKFKSNLTVAKQIILASLSTRQF